MELFTIIIYTSHPYFYDDVFNKAKTLKSYINKLVKYWQNAIRKGNELATIVHSLRQVYFAKI
jgi:hypothetical protein